MNASSATVVGIDVTSTPTRRKPLVAAFGRLHGTVLHVDEVVRWKSFTPFETLLASRGDAAPSIIGIDAPLGLPRSFVEQTGWPAAWDGYVRAAAAMTRAEWRTLLAAFRAGRPTGDKYQRRDTDVLAGAQSPLNPVRPPVALMFHEIAPRLQRAGVDVRPARPGLGAAVVETYPALAARHLAGSPYKDDRPHHGGARRSVRRDLVARLQRDAFPYLERVEMRDDVADGLVDDVQADGLDAVLCAIQAAWAWRHPSFGVPDVADFHEGWIVDPATLPARDR